MKFHLLLAVFLAFLSVAFAVTDDNRVKMKDVSSLLEARSSLRNAKEANKNMEGSLESKKSGGGGGESRDQREINNSGGR